MMALDQLDNNRNWVRAAMGLKYLKEGLESFVENEITNLQISFLQDIRSSHGLATTVTCNLCKLENVLPCPTKGFCRGRGRSCNFHRSSVKCANNLCDKIAAKIVSQHRFDSPCWKNTDVSKWCSSPWEIAKCFMTNGYSNKNTANETDCKGILSVIFNCLSLQSSLTTLIDPPGDIFSKMADNRNTIIHSATLEVTDAELQQYIDDMIGVLNDSKMIQTHPDAVTARAKLDQIKTNNLVISSRDELNLRKEAIKALEEKQNELLDQSQQQKIDLQEKQKEILDQFQQQQKDIKQEHKEFLDQSQKTREDLNLSADQARNSITGIATQCEQKQSQLNSKVDQVVEEEQQRKQKQDNLQFMMESLQSQMEKVLDAVQSENNRVQSVQVITDAHREHVKKLENRELLHTRLREKYRSFQSNIPLSPILKNMNFDIDNIYQRLVIRPDLIHDPNERKKDKKTMKINETENIINDYKGIFFNDSVSCKHIFVVGKGGVGKTTWCLKLLSTWLNRKTKDADYDNVLLQKFEYVFYIQLRHTKQASMINDMIKSYIFPDEQDLMNTVNDVLLNEPDQCLVLLDGLDEWKLPSEQSMHDNGLPYHPMHTKYTTLITSRPWKLEMLRLEPPAIDKAVEIKGLDTYGIRKLAGFVIDQLNCVQDKNKELKMFLGCIQKRKMPMIEVPLMLNIFVYLWYENDFIGETLAGLYGQLTADLLKHAEGDKRLIKQNREVSKLADIKDIDKRKSTWSNIDMSLPDCLGKGVCKSYNHLLHALGKLAFDGLVSKNIETFLVFTQESIETYMSEEALEVALYIGILSQSQSIGDSTGERFSISFMHKTIQEFFAAVYMVYVNVHDETANKIGEFLSYCKHIDNFFENENVFIFICGMDPKLAGVLTREISVMYRNNWATTGDIYDINTHLDKVYYIVMRIVREENLYSNESNHVCNDIHCIMPDKPYNEALSYIQLNHNRVPMCLHIRMFPDMAARNFKEIDTEKEKKDRYEYEDAICRCLSGVHTLETLRLFGGTTELRNDKGCCRISECINHLYFQKLDLVRITGNLGYIDLSNNTILKSLTMIALQIEDLSLPQDGCLESVELKYIKHPHGDQGRLVLNMNNPQRFKTLKLFDIIGTVNHINLSNNTELKNIKMTSLQIEDLSLPQNGNIQSAELINIKCPHGNLENLSFNMKNQPYLEQLTLVNVSGNVGHIHLSNNTKLTNFKITSLQIEELSLPQDGCLQSVDIKSIKHPKGDKVKLTLNINNQTHLKRLTLENITGNVGHINLSNKTKFTDLRMKSLQIEELSLPQDGCIQSVDLKSIMHPHGDQVRLTLNINNQTHLKRLTLENITENVGHINLSNKIELTDLRMATVKIEEISLPQGGCLQKVFLKYIKHPSADQESITLNINNQTSLKSFTLEDIRIKEDHIDLSKNKRLTAVSVVSVPLVNITVPPGVVIKK